MQALSSTTLQRLNVHFAFTALENTKKRQVLIVSSPRPQRKRAAIRSQGKFLLGASNHPKFERPSCWQRLAALSASRRRRSHYTKTPVDGQPEFGMLPFFLLTV
jgi:hypothetical protein